MSSLTVTRLQTLSCSFSAFKPAKTAPFVGRMEITCFPWTPGRWLGQAPQLNEQKGLEQTSRQNFLTVLSSGPCVAPWGRRQGGLCLLSPTEHVKGVKVDIVAETNTPDSGLSFHNRAVQPGHTGAQRKDAKSAHQPLWHQEKVTKHGKQSLRPVMT